MELNEIEIENIQKLIPGILQKKLIKLGIKNVQQLIDFNIGELSKQQGVGNRVIEEFTSLKQWLIENQEEILALKPRNETPIISFELSDSLLKVEFELEVV